jgi:hypothetical protein
MICFDLHWREGETRPGLTGFGCGVPPLHNLEPFEIPASVEEGVDGTLANYPWTPPANMLRTYPWSTRTGVAVVDSVLAALETGGPLPVQGTQIACVEEPQGIGAPPMCPEGVAEGTLVDGFFSSTCEGSWGLVREIHADQLFGQNPGPKRLFAVGRPDPPSRGVEEGGGLPRDYLIVLALPLESGGDWEAAPYTLGIRGGGVVSTHVPCGGTLEGWAIDPTLTANGWLLPPR